MSNSSLVNYIKISPHKTSGRNHKIDKITIHHMAGNLSVETCGNVFQTREASSNYGIGSDGRVGMYVEEKDRSWASSSRSNDNRAVTIEVADDIIGNGWHSSDIAMNKLILLCADICIRNGIKKLNYTGNTSGNLTMHKWFTSTDCPGSYLESKFPWIAEQVNNLINQKSKGLGDPVFIKQKEQLDIGFNFCMPNNEGRFKWLLYDVAKNQWETLVDWTDSNWISLKKDKSKIGYLIQCQLYDLDMKNAKLIDTKTIGTDAGTGTVINGTYASWQGDNILLGCSSNNQNVNVIMKIYNCTTKQWFTQFTGQWASFKPDKGTNYIVQFEIYDKDGTLMDYRSIGV